MWESTSEKGDQKESVFWPQCNIYRVMTRNLGNKVRNFRLKVFHQHLIISGGRVSVWVTMLSPSRHGGRGGVAGEEGVKPEKPSEITPYEVERNRRKKVLHDEVQRALKDSRFNDAAQLRSLFTREETEKEAGAEKRCNVSRVEGRPIPGDSVVKLRRSARTVRKVNTSKVSSPVCCTKSTRVREHITCHFPYV
jgi:hypothetical protein